MSYREDKKEWTLRRIIKYAGIITLIVVSLLYGIQALIGSNCSIPSGYKGVLLNFGQVTGMLNEGFNWKTPFIQDVQLVNIQVQVIEHNESAASSDLQEVTTQVTINYQIEDSFEAIKYIYTNFRDAYASRLIAPIIQDTLKGTTADFTAEQLITHRSSVMLQMKETLADRLRSFYIKVVAVSLTDFRFSEAFTKAIEDKVVKEQQALQEKNNLEIVRYQAQQQIIQALAKRNATLIEIMTEYNKTIMYANGEAQRQMIEANAQYQARLYQAQGESMYLKLVSGNMTSLYLSYLALQRWDGKLPIVWISNGNSTLPIIMLPNP